MMGHGLRRAGLATRGLLLVAALGVSLAACGGASSTPATQLYPTLPIPTPTTTPPPPTATARPAGAQWIRVPAGASASGEPDSLRVQYHIDFGQSSKTSSPQFDLRRSDDFGATWANLTPPSLPGVNYSNAVNYAVGTTSPLNTRVFVLTLQLMITNCPAPASGANGGCQAQYVTQDGGASWRLLTLPAKGLLGVCNLYGTSKGELSAQGSRLYAAVNDCALASGGGAIPPGRLVASDDGGATWKVVDSALAARNLLIYDFTVSPIGSAIFALVGATNQDLPPGQTPPLTLWRSLDAGASWAQISPPAAHIVDMLAASDASGNARIYLFAGASFDALNLYASRDGGAHWTPWSGQPQSSQSMPALLAALPNGSVLVDAATNVFEWDGSGGAPRAVAQPTGLIVGPQATLQPQANGAVRVWLWGRDQNGSALEYATITP